MASTATLVTNLEVTFNGWLSIYQAEISNPFLPQMQAMLVSLLLVSPNRTNFML